MPRAIRWMLLTFVLACLVRPLPAPPPESRAAEDILKAFVDDFRSDQAAAAPCVFAVSVKGAAEPDWHVVVAGRKDAAGRYEVALEKGLPAKPTFVYVTDAATLGKIDRGEMNALTAMGKARESDAAPMDVTVMPGFEPNEDFVTMFLPLTFHFWTRGFPEIVNFDEAKGREVHGATMVVFYYQKGLRSGWGQIRKGQHVNADPRDQVNPFPAMFIGLRGRAVGKIGGNEKVLGQGQMVFVPPGTTHEFWNPYEEPAEFIVLMFGDGA